MNAAGSLLTDLTGVQALLRPLNPGETRQALCKRTKKKVALNKLGYMKVDPRISLALDKVAVFSNPGRDPNHYPRPSTPRFGDFKSRFLAGSRPTVERSRHPGPPLPPPFGRYTGRLDKKRSQAQES